MSLRFVRSLEADEYAELTSTFKTSKDIRLVHRCHAVLLSADGWRVPKIAELLHVDQATIHRWLDRFEAGGVQALVIEWGSTQPGPAFGHPLGYHGNSKRLATMRSR